MSIKRIFTGMLCGLIFQIGLLVADLLQSKDGIRKARRNKLLDLLIDSVSWLPLIMGLVVQEGLKLPKGVSLIIMLLVLPCLGAIIGSTEHWILWTLVPIVVLVGLTLYLRYLFSDFKFI